MAVTPTMIAEIKQQDLRLLCFPWEFDIEADFGIANGAGKAKPDKKGKKVDEKKSE